MKLTLPAEYGMVFVLFLLCAYFSVATWNEQHPNDEAAGQRLATELVERVGTGGRVLIVVRDTRDDAEFADAVAAQLTAQGVSVAGKVQGDPASARQTIEAILGRGESFDAVAANQAAAGWGVLQNLGEHFPRLRNVPVVRPESYSWPDFLKLSNLRNITNQIAIIAILAIGMTMVIITGGIDLSVGSLIALSAVTAAWLIRAGGGDGLSYLGDTSGSTLLWAGALAVIGVMLLALARRVRRAATASGLGVVALTFAGILGIYGAYPAVLRPLVTFLGQQGPTPIVQILACVLAMAMCGALGWFSGAMVTYFRVPPFIVTLSMMLVASGLAYKISQGQSIHQIPVSFTWLGLGADLFNIPNSVVLMVVLYFLAHVLMTRMVLGRYIYAVGGNAEAARLSGVPVKRVLLFVYTASALLAGLGGVIMASQFKSGTPTYGEKYELYVIAAAVVGGTSIAGGEGKILGTLIGAFIIAVIQNGMNLTGMRSEDQTMVLGFVILAAVLFDTAKRRVAGGK